MARGPATPLEDERLPGWVRPSSWYLTGFLVPRGKRLRNSERTPMRTTTSSRRSPERRGLGDDSTEDRRAARRGLLSIVDGLELPGSRWHRRAGRDRPLGRLRLHVKEESADGRRADDVLPNRALVQRSRDAWTTAAGRTPRVAHLRGGNGRLANGSGAGAMLPGSRTTRAGRTVSPAPRGLIVLAVARPVTCCELCWPDSAGDSLRVGVPCERAGAGGRARP